MTGPLSRGRIRVLLGVVLTLVVVVVVVVALLGGALRGPSPAAPSESSPVPATTSDTAAPGGAGSWVVSEVVDGDTVDATRGGVTERVRLLGVDTPERGQCGFEEAARALALLALGRPVELVVAGQDERDRYGRLLAYVDVLPDVDGGAGPLDAGLSLVSDGYGTARYDSRDGYGAHEREAAYVAADEVGGSVAGCPDPPTASPSPSPATTPPATADVGVVPPAEGTVSCDPAYPGTCIPPGPPDLDCGDVEARSFVVLPPDPHRFDADGNGFGCESG